MSDQRNLPQGDEIVLDHVGHFVADLEKAGHALAQAGFHPTPFSAQVAPTGPNGALELTGTGNVCAMLQRGYIEILGQTADTVLGRELAMAVKRWSGVHLTAFAVADAEAAHARLDKSGFETRNLVSMKRPVATEDGMDEARFTVARVSSQAMPEGRVQILTHHTEDAVWQKRWLNHPNGAEALLGVLLVSGAPDEAASRFARFADRLREDVPGGARIPLSRGHVQILGADAALPLVGNGPGLPWFAGYGVQVKSLSAMRAWLQQNALAYRDDKQALTVAFPAALGRGFWVFVEAERDLPWKG